MSDLIDREAALNCFHCWADKNGDVYTPEEIPEYRAIEALPSAQPEIIRCRECQYWEREKPFATSGRCFIWECTERKGSDYCSEARKVSE